MTVTPINEDTHGAQGREIANENWTENQKEAGTASIPVHYLPNKTPNAPIYRLIKPDGSPEPTSDAVEFTAEGSVTIPHYAGLDFLTDFTVDFWAYLDSAGQNNYILTKIPTAASQIFRIQQNVSGLRIQTGSNTLILANIDAWNHIVLTYNQSLNDLDIYVDGAFQTTISVAFASNTNDWNLGSRFPVDIGAWTGLIDELKLVGAYYSAADVTASYNLGLGVAGNESTPNIINGYSFNNVLTDYSGNENNALVNGVFGYNTGKVGDPLGGTGIFAYVFENGKDQEMPFIINVPEGFNAEKDDECHLNAKAYILGAFTGNVEFKVYWSWTDVPDLLGMQTPTQSVKQYALLPIHKNLVVSTSADPFIMVKAEQQGGGVITGLFRRNGTTDPYSGDIALLSLSAKFIYT